MAYAQHRSCVADLHAGATDATYKKYAPDRGGVLEDTTAAVRRVMSGVWHGFNESSTKPLPDGTMGKVPYYNSVTPQDTENV